jgi:hypothetical protein
MLTWSLGCGALEGSESLTVQLALLRADESEGPCRRGPLPPLTSPRVWARGFAGAGISIKPQPLDLVPAECDAVGINSRVQRGHQLAKLPPALGMSQMPGRELESSEANTASGEEFLRHQPTTGETP